MAGNQTILIETGIRASFDDLQIQFLSVLQDYGDDFKRIIQAAIDNFDFESLLTDHVRSKIIEGLEKAFDEIDMTNTLKVMVWNELEKKLNLKES